ncbi:methylthiotransferase [Actinidia rufa]|uniref:Methylthiotransferase n=1 Tax=Actinidia rufa TaxID=165716 RepID=A0A7J0E1P8_9ERIC|nr:methylthiotransferase [Actinidia rufa]
MAASLSSLSSIISQPHRALGIKFPKRCSFGLRFLPHKPQTISYCRNHRTSRPLKSTFSLNFSRSLSLSHSSMSETPSLRHFIAQAAVTSSETQSDPTPISETLPRSRIYHETYGCQMNINDMEIVLSIMKKAGYGEVVEVPESAEIIFINTCAIRDNAEQRVPCVLPKVVVLGCMAERLKDKILDADKMVDVVCGPDAYRDLPRLLEEVDYGQKGINTLLSLEETYADISPVRISKNSIAAFVSNFGKEGVKEVTLLGQNVNSYNDASGAEKDVESGANWKFSEGFSSMSKVKNMGLRFADLLDELATEFPEMRFRYTSPHPKDFPDELLYVMRDRYNICKSIHLPAQTGSSTVLERMRRGYTREAYLDLVQKIRRIIPDVGLSSDFICGFCGETEEEHKDTLSLVKAVGYDMAYMFAYSMREKTHAHRNYIDDVPDAVKQRRLTELIDAFRERAQVSALTPKLVLFNLVSFTNLPVPERDDYDGMRNPRVGDFVEVRISKSTRASLFGEALAITKLSSFYNSVHDEDVACANRN